MHTEKVVCQHCGPVQVDMDPSLSSRSGDAGSAGVECRSTRNAYMYENADVPMKGAYERIPKLRPRFAEPQIAVRMPGL